MSEAANVEVERKFDAAESDQVPELISIRGVANIRRGGDVSLDAMYFDTAALDLAAHRITLRRRTGGADAGWHLKLPVSADQRREITEPLGDEPNAVPPGLRSMILAHIRNHELIAVAHVKTRRTPVRLLADDGTELAEFCDDRIHATTLIEPVEESEWREWELELVKGPRKLLAHAADVFEAAGHRPAKLPSKLARALKGSYPGDRPPMQRPRAKGPASAVLLTYINEQVQALKAHDPGVRAGDPGAIHQLRVAARKVRSVLSSFRGLTDKQEAQLLRDELQWLAGTIGTARDIDVMRTHLTAAIDAEPPTLNPKGAKQHLDQQLEASYEDALSKGVDALNSDRYFNLLDSLDRFLATPPLTKPAHKKASKTLEHLVNVERRRLKKDVKAVIASGAASGGSALHEVRKSAKRLRYAADAAAPIFGKQATKVCDAAKKIQSILGEHQDSIVIRERLRSLAVDSPGADAGIGFMYGRLHALEQQRAVEARTQFVRTWNTSPPKPLHR